MILKRFEVGPYAANCYIVGDESGKEGLIIDPGDEPKEILKTVKAAGLTVKLIVITHGHVDHCSAVTEVKKKTGAPVAIHSNDAGRLPVTPDKVLKGGDAVEVGGLHFTVLHTPGHSPGSICLLGDGVLFSGDTLFNFGIGRYDFAGGSYRQIMDSLHNKLMTLPDTTVVYPGHGPETTIGTERLGNPFLRH